MADTTKARSERDMEDMTSLMRLPAFKRFLFRIIEASSIHASAYGSDERRLNGIEGRRSLGFDILRWADESQRADGDGMASLLMILLEVSAATPPSETRNERPRYDRNSELLDEDGPARE